MNSETKEKELELQVQKLNKTVLLYQKKLKRSELNRAKLEDINEKSRYLLKTINTEIEKAKKTIEQKNLNLEQLNQALTVEKQKSEDLLLNILPETVAEELKRKGKVEPVYFEQATVLFTDFEGFTKISANISPQELVRELDFCFSSFDRIIEKHGLERLKTIGDAYMCAGGLTESDRCHCVDAVKAALEIVEFMKEHIQTKKEQDIPYWNIRIGIHSGPIVAGIVGKKKFAYDIWGDTVNIASRVETTSKAGRINISKETYERVKEHFTFEYRGKIPIKNRGLIDMFFVNGLQTLNHYSKT